MNLIVLDLEMNQPSNKIIELGFIVANTKKRSVLYRGSVLVDPGEPLSEDIVKLTSITDEVVTGQGTVLDAYDKMAKVKQRYQASAVVAQWGSGDLRLLLNQAGVEPKDSAFRMEPLNVKMLYYAYAAFMPQGVTKGGLAASMSRLGMEFEGFQHRAVHDAENTWRVLDCLCNKMVKYDQMNALLK